MTPIWRIFLMSDETEIAKSGRDAGAPTAPLPNGASSVGSGQILDEVRRIIRRFGSIYFGDEEPKKSNFLGRFFCAFTGVIAFGISVLPDQLPSKLAKIRAAADEILRKLEATPKSQGTDYTPETNYVIGENIDWAVYRFYEDLINRTLENSYILLFFFAVAMAIVIASGIKYGGPLRMFFAGVLVPLAVMAITNLAL